MRSISVVRVARKLSQVSIAPFTASTNTTRPTSEITYLANRPSRRNQILSLTPIIRTLVRATSSGVRIRTGGAPNGGWPRSSAANLAQFGPADCESPHVVSPDYGQLGRVKAVAIPGGPIGTPPLRLPPPPPSPPSRRGRTRVACWTLSLPLPPLRGRAGVGALS